MGLQPPAAESLIPNLLSNLSLNFTGLYGCDFVDPISKYDTQIHVKRIFAREQRKH
jgi:hypothetical protein